MGNKVYTAAYSYSINPGLNFTSNFSINSPGREIKLKSVGFTWRIENTANGETLPISANTDQVLILIIGQFTVKYASCFDYISNPPAFQGDVIRLYEPMQYFFDSFFIVNNLPFSLQITNLNAANVRDHHVDIFVETEEKPMYQ